MNPDKDVFRRVVEALGRAHVPFMITGSFASSYYGVTRSTQDIDFVVDPSPDQIQSFVRSLSAAEYYVNEEAAIEAQRHQSQFNVIDLDAGWKVDLIIRKARAFSREEFDRRRAAEFDGVPFFVTTAEDLILAKLEWAKLGESQRQIDDVAAGPEGSGHDREWWSILYLPLRSAALPRQRGSPRRRRSGW